MAKTYLEQMMSAEEMAESCRLKVAKPYVYYVVEYKTSKKYIGLRYANTTKGRSDHWSDDLFIHYFTSGEGKNSCREERWRWGIIRIAEFENKKQAGTFETGLILELNAAKEKEFYNKSVPGFDARIEKHSPESIEKIREASLSRCHTEEVKRRISKSHTGKIISSATKEKNRQRNKEQFEDPVRRQRHLDACLQATEKKNKERDELRAKGLMPLKYVPVAPHGSTEYKNHQRKKALENYAALTDAEKQRRQRLSKERSTTPEATAKRVEARGRTMRKKKVVKVLHNYFFAKFVL